MTHERTQLLISSDCRPLVGSYRLTVRPRDHALSALTGGGFGLLAGLACLLPGRGTLDALLLPLATILPLPALVAGLHQRATAGVAAVVGFGVGVQPAMPPLGATAVLLAWAALLLSLAADPWAAVREHMASARSAAQRSAAKDDSEFAATRAFAVMMLAAAWLAWPIWLAPQLVAWEWTVPSWATRFHPLFAINAAALDRGVWTQQPAVYQLTPLGQDLAYALPDSPWRTAAVLLVASLLCVSAKMAVRQMRVRAGGEAT